jgi:hypothetical protein
MSGTGRKSVVKHCDYRNAKTADSTRCSPRGPFAIRLIDQGGLRLILCVSLPPFSASAYNSVRKAASIVPHHATPNMKWT